ncbi:MAG: hypothetical protein ACREBC_32965, partial [Pyrinomonadaceae bacterium]
LVAYFIIHSNGNNSAHASPKYKNSDSTQGIQTRAWRFLDEARADNDEENVRFVSSSSGNLS